MINFRIKIQFLKKTGLSSTFPIVRNILIQRKHFIRIAPIYMILQPFLDYDFD